MSACGSKTISGACGNPEQPLTFATITTASHGTERRRSTRNQAREEKRALEDALALSLGNADGTENTAVPSTQRSPQTSSRKRKASSDGPKTPPKKPKATQSADTTKNGGAGQKTSPRGQAKVNQTNAKAGKASAARTVSVPVKQWLQDGLYADDKDLQARTETFATKEASWLDQVQKGREKDHLVKFPPADMKYVYFRNNQPVLALGAGDAPYRPQPRKSPRTAPRKKSLVGSPSNKNKPRGPESFPEAATESSKLPKVPNPELSPHGDPGTEAPGNRTAPAAFRDLLGPISSESANISTRILSSPAASSAVAEPKSSALFPPNNTVRVGFSFGPIPALMQYRFKQNSSNQESDTQEEAFAARPSIKILIPDTLKGLLVDDWENITKNNQLVPIPHPTPVSKIIEDYVNYEKPQRPENSASIDILEETLAGLKEYFDRSLGRILLYRFERAQYAEVREKWNPGGDMEGKSASETYGAEHLMRLMVSLPELIAQTNMDQQSVNRLREELSKFCVWLEKNAGTYFVSQYESPNAEYAEKAKN